jgi:hypothetical protein
LFAGLLIVFLIGFSDLAAMIARGVLGQPAHPVAFWLMTGVILVSSVWFCYVIVAEWRRGSRLPKK